MLLNYDVYLTFLLILKTCFILKIIFRKIKLKKLNFIFYFFYEKYIFKIDIVNSFLLLRLKIELKKTEKNE